MKRRSSFALGFLALIAIGAALLGSPAARVAGEWGDPVSALFTAWSAVCVTGLTVVDIGSEYTVFGQIVLMALVEIGCLGLMTYGTFLLIAIGRRLSLSREFSLMNAYGVEQIQGLKGLVCWTVMSMLAVEAVAAVALYPATKSWYDAVFYSIMSFCNAGFGIYPGSLSRYFSPYPILIMGFETILGGIGFLVLYNLCTYRFLNRSSGARGRISLHTRIVLRFTAYLLAIAFVAFVALEWNGSLSGMSAGKKLLAAFYQAITPRTCGFAVVPTESLHPLTRLVYEFLMFIGGAPGSAAAGMKGTTLAVLVYTLCAMCRGESETVIEKRTISMAIVRESLVIFMAMVVFAAVITGALFFTEAKSSIPSDALFFEAVSAITTTGLSVGGTTSSLSIPGRFVIMVAMFIGRLGALTVVMMIGDRESIRMIRYPHEELVVG
ncbi:MAG: hypothetical protein ILO34_07565 [Kiritimatiellae bacterium]|nr:hypothetical protein [Kiritimatiellia bacterium]